MTLELLGTWEKILKWNNFSQDKCNFSTLILSTVLQACQFQIYCGLLRILTRLVNIW